MNAPAPQPSPPPFQPQTQAPAPAAQPTSVMPARVQPVSVAASPTAVAHAPAVSQTPPTADEPPQRMFGVEVRESEDSRRGLDHASVSWLKRMSLAFAAFFVFVCAVTLMRENARHAAAISASAVEDATAAAQIAGLQLDRHVAWAGTVASGTRTPAQAVDLAVRGANVIGAAVVGPDGQLLASAPAGYDDVFSAVAPAQADSVEITSLVAQNGSGVFPIVSQPLRSGRLLLALPPGALGGGGADGISLVATSSGKIIDGPSGYAQRGLLPSTGLTREGLDALTSGQGATAEIAVGGAPALLAAAAIPNTDLSLLKSAAKTRSPRFLPMALVFATLLAGTCGVVLAMMNNVLRHVGRAQNDFAADEVTRQRYEAVIDNTGGGIFEIDLSANTAFVSDSLVRLLNLGDEERTLPLSQFLSLFDSGERDKLYNHIRRAHMTGEFEMEVDVTHLPLILSMRARPLMRGDADSDDGQRKVIIGLALDVTEASGAKARLQAAEARLFDALRSMSDAFVIWDQRDRLVLWNRRFENFFGFEAGQLQPGLDHGTVEYHANANIQESHVLADGTGQEILLKDGRWIRYLETPTRDGGRVSIGTEVTQIRHREHELRINHEKLQSNVSMLQDMQMRLIDLAQSYENEKIRAEEANQSKSEFLANMSHELRTPLNAINGFSDIMQKEMFGPLGDPRYKEYVNDILFSGRHLLSLINDILDMSKIEAGKMTLNVDTLHINDMIKQVVRILRGRAEENRLKLIYTDVNAQAIQADPRAVKQILLNLITNAIKFTPEGGVVRVECEPKSAGLVIRVSDSGIGISEEDLARLAQPFEQASNNTSGEGTGLGLALSKSLTELHGGNFHIASTIGEGTTITFTLPNAPIVTEAKAKSGGVGDEITRIATTISAALQQGADAAQAAAEAGAGPELARQQPPAA